MAEYRFYCQIRDADTGEVIEQDWCTITDARVDEFGGCETVDHRVAAFLRMWRRTGREEYEKRNAPIADDESDETALTRG